MENKSLSLWKLDEKFVGVMTRLEECEGVPDEVLDAEMDAVFAAIAKKETGYVQAHDTVQTMIDQGKSWIERFQKRVRTLERAKERMKLALLDHMNTIETDVIETDLGKIRRMKTEKVVIDDEKKLPTQFVRVITEYKPDKVRIKKALKAGELEGAHIETSEYIRIF